MIEVDVRESNLIHLLKAMEPLENVNVEQKQLPIGDVIIKNEEQEEVVIIERKTPKDLIASIKDGRYKEQSMRLHANELHNHHIFYLIEGNIDNVEKKWKQTIRSAIFSINYYKGFSIWNTHSVLGTAEFICDMFLKLKKENFKKGIYMETREIQSDSYVSCIKKTKSDNINTDNINAIMLSQIPGVSAKISEIIMNNYENIFTLKEAIQDDRDCLKHITYTLSNGQIRHINKKTIENIILFFNIDSHCDDVIQDE